VVQSEKALVAAESAEREARRSFGTQRDAVAALHPPEPTGESLAEDWSELAAWAEDRLVEVRRERELVAEEGRAAAIVKAERIDQLTRQAETLAVDADPAGLMVAIAAARAATSAEIDRIIERQEEQRSQTEALARLEETRVVHGALGQHLSANGFERWLLTEALDDLVARATVRLLELSSGQYSLIAVDSAFRIIDHRNADEPRDVRTLSGGETFLASLSLALALADSIGELAPADAPRLGSMFLDEGFGTLDAETLDVVATAIEELSSSGRLVGIVTHIEALAERMPVRVVVVKGPSGSSVRVEAS
jgi:DNA repair protein SbcC/Rad50